MAFLRDALAFAVVESRLLLTETLRERSISAQSKLCTSDQ